MDRPSSPPAHLRTAHDCFAAAVARVPDGDFLCIPAHGGRDYHPDGITYSYAAMAGRVAMAQARLERSGFGHGHSVAVMLGNRPEHFEQFLAANALGVCIVPVSPDYTPAEIAHLLGDSGVDMVIATAARLADVRAAAALSRRHLPIHDIDALPERFGPPSRDARAGTPDRETIASLLYTSGTTGLPKGCLVSNEYFVSSGQWYASRGGRMTFEDDIERLFNPFPVFHMNAGVISAIAMMLTGGCLISADRFHPRSWWKDIAATRATIMHYMGVIPAMLMSLPRTPEERAHGLKFGMGAGVAPTLHAAFEERFGFPLIEVWGMTETGRLLPDNIEPRSVDKRAFGRAVPGLDVRIVDADDNEVPRGEIGEFTVRHSAEEPRKGFFSGYLNHDELTEHVWRGGWFHTGDVVRQEADGLLVFVDRTKNMVRRSGENISAGEVEAALASHPDVVAVAVLAVPDELREEEVLACVVPAGGCPRDAVIARALIDHCRDRLAYFKLPGWLIFRDSLPTTNTNKVQHRLIFAAGEDPRQAEGCFDLRQEKAGYRTRKAAATN